MMVPPTFFLWGGVIETLHFSSSINSSTDEVQKNPATRKVKKKKSNTWFLFLEERISADWLTPHRKVQTQLTSAKIQILEDKTETGNRWWACMNIQWDCITERDLSCWHRNIGGGLWMHYLFVEFSLWEAGRFFFSHGTLADLVPNPDLPSQPSFRQ